GGDVQLGKIGGMFRQSFGGGRSASNVLTDHLKRLLETGVPGPVDEKIPDTQDRKPRLDESQQLLIENQEFAERQPFKSMQIDARTATTRPTFLQPKDQESLSLQLRPNQMLFLTLKLAIEGRAVGTSDSVGENGHRSFKAGRN
ncbi:MAG TPA: hypothetical protein VIU63_00790, partial [Nitrospira sp.]